MTSALATIPAELRALPQWCCWRYIKRGDAKPTKVPFRPDGRPAKSDDPSTWSEFGSVVEARGFSGIGFVFSDSDPYVGIDLDNALDGSGVLKPGWRKIVERFGTYTEVSPSGTGVKLWIKGRWPGLQSETGRRVNWRDGQIEAYWRGRYFAVTGLVYDGTPTEIAEAQDALDGLYRKVLTPQQPSRKVPVGEAVERCVAYLRRCPDAISGQDGHGKTLRAACECWRFGLSDADAEEVMRWWNTEKSAPPWSDRELRHKLDDARKIVLASGEFGMRVRQVVTPRVQIEPPPAQCGSLDVLVDGIIGGTRRNIPWPWRTLTESARALLPGTITVLSGMGGSSKSLMVSHACLFWLSTGVPFAVFHLEEDRDYHVLRALAQHAGDSRVTDDAWVRQNGDRMRGLLAEHREVLDSLGQRVWDAPSADVTLDDLLGWVGERADEGVRIIVVDPVTAANSGKEPWNADREFVLGAKRVLRESGASLIVVTHPRNGDPKFGSRMDNHAGGQAYNRFTQTVLMLSACDSRSAHVRAITNTGEEWARMDDVNRILRVAKARNGRGTGTDIGFWFASESLRFAERGRIDE